MTMHSALPSPSAFWTTSSRSVRRLALTLLAGASLSGAVAGNYYVFDALTPNWYEGENPLTQASAGGRLQVAATPTNSILVNALGTGGEFPKPQAGDWAGATWTAPKGEVVSAIHMVGDFRRETLEYEDYGAGVYGGKGDGAPDEVKLLFSAGGAESAEGPATWNEKTQKITYDWTIPVDPALGITQLQFRAWEAIAGGVVIQAGSSPRGYSGYLTNLEITTVPAPAQSGKVQSGSPAKTETITLGDQTTRLTLSDRGEILELEDLETKTPIFASGVRPPAWKLVWRTVLKGGEDISVSEGFKSADAPKAPTAEEERGTLTSLRYGAPQVVRGKNEVTFIWKQADLPTVTGKVTFDEKEKQFLFAATVENRSNLIIERLSFPPAMSFNALADNSVIVAADNAYNTSLKPLDKLKPFITMYPGYLFMQMAAFKIGDSSLLIYTNDDQAFVKWMVFTREGQKVGFDLSQQIRLKPGATWSPSYSVVWKVIPRGTYHEQAAAYAAWGRQQWWAKEKTADKLAKRPALQRYFSGGLVRLNAGPPVCDTSSFRQTEDTRWHYIEGNKYAKFEPYYDNIIDSITAYQKAYDFQPGYWHGVWSGHQFDSMWPDYFPVEKYMGDFDKFKADLIKNRYPMLYHMNTAQWSETAPTSKETKYLAVTDKGTPYRIWFTWSKQWSVLTSPAVALEQEMKTVNRIRDDAGFNGVYLDVIGHSFATDENPKSPYHGQPNDYQLQKIEAFKTIREAVTGPLMTEARNEIELAYMDMGTGGNGSPEEDEVPLWELVYGDCAANTTYAVKDKRLRYYTWMLGGVQATTWDWPAFDGKRIPVFLTAAQQKAISPVVPERMERFDRLGEARLSQWPSGLVLWNKAKSGAPVDLASDTKLGRLEVSQLSPGGLVIWNKNNEFTVDSANEVRLGGKQVFHFEGAKPLSINRAGGRWVIHNENAEPVSGTIRAIAATEDPKSWDGKLALSGKAVTLTPKMENGWIALSVEIPPGDCLIIGQSLETGANIPKGTEAAVKADEKPDQA